MPSCASLARALGTAGAARAAARPDRAGAATAPLTPALGRHRLFVRLLQALIELVPAGSEERSVLESVSNHIAARAGITHARGREGWMSMHAGAPSC